MHFNANNLDVIFEYLEKKNCCPYGKILAKLHIIYKNVQKCKIMKFLMRIKLQLQGYSIVHYSSDIIVKYF